MLVAPRSAIPLLMVACRTAYVTQERATKICLADPSGVSAAPRAVARWDGNVALQRWGCGRCRSGNGSRGYRFTAQTFPLTLFQSLSLFFSFFFLSPSSAMLPPMYRDYRLENHLRLRSPLRGNLLTLGPPFMQLRTGVPSYVLSLSLFLSFSVFSPILLPKRTASVGNHRRGVEGFSRRFRALVDCRRGSRAFKSS